MTKQLINQGRVDEEQKKNSDGGNDRVFWGRKIIGNIRV